MRNVSKHIALVLVLALLLQFVPGFQLATTAKAAETMIEVLYEEDFNEYTGDNTVTINKGESKEGWTYDGAYGKGTFQLKDGALYAIDAGNNAHLELDIPGAEYWQNYTVEVDWTYVGSTSWGGFAYNSNGANSHQKFGIHGTNGYFMNGNFGAQQNWVNDGGSNNYTSSAVSCAADKTVRLKAVTSKMNGVDTGSTALYIAYYDAEGKLGDWNHVQTVTNIDARTFRGSIGIATNSYNTTNAKVDNIKVYREVEVLYKTDFSDAANELKNWNVKNDVKATVADGKMTLVSGGTAYGDVILNVEGSADWQNYTIEADFTYEKGYYFAGLAFNFIDECRNEKAGVYFGSGRNTDNPSTPKYFINGRWDTDGFSEGEQGWLQHDHPGAGSANAAFTYGKPYRLKVSLTGQCGWQAGEATLSIAHYDDEGNLGPWIPISATNKIDSRMFKGPAGILTSASAGTMHVDNFVVYKPDVTAPEAPKPANVANIYDVTPTTGITNPPVVGELVDNFDEINRMSDDFAERTPALALVELFIGDNELWVAQPTDGAITPMDGFMDMVRGTIIPGFIVESEEEALALAEYCEEINLIDAYVVAEIDNTDDAEAIGYVTTAREAWTSLRGAVIIPTVGDTVADWRDLCLTMANDTDVTVVFAQEVVPLDAMSYFNNHSIAVWGYAETKADVFNNIQAGAHGILSTDAQMIYDVYESIEVTTLSGRPMPITHRGNHMGAYSSGLYVSKTLIGADGQPYTFTGYTENSVAACVSSFKDAGVLGSEIDLHTTAVCSGNDATCTHAKDLIAAGQPSCGHTNCKLCQKNIILEHDGNLESTTNIEQMRSDAKYGTLFSKSNNKTAYTLYELKLLTLDGRGRNIVDTNDWTTSKMATFEEVLQATENLANGNYVYYCHIGSADQNFFNKFLTENPQYVDNCVIFMDASGIENSYNYKTLTVPVPITFADNNRLSATVNQEHLDAIEDMILLMNRHNGHYLGYHYQRHTDGNDDFYYEAAARGIVTYHSITNGQAALAKRHITGEGAVGCLTDQSSYVDDWFYAIDLGTVPASIQAGTALDVDATVRTLWGDANPAANLTDVELGVQSISGPEFVETKDGWTAEEGGKAEIVFYYDGTAEGATYRVYSQPVEIEVVAGVTGVNMSTSAAQAVVGQKLYLYAAVTPTYATDKSVTWTSSEESVATVDANGVVTPIAVGTATITATTTDGGFTATCEVTVVAEDAAVAAVKAKIEALNDESTAEDVAAARAAYEDLLASQKVLVDNYAKLLTAEAAQESKLEEGLEAAETELKAAQDAQKEAEDKAKEAQEAADKAAAEAEAAAEAAKAAQDDATLSAQEKEAAEKAAADAEAAAKAAKEEAEAAAAELKAAEDAVAAAQEKKEEAEAAAELATVKLEMLLALTELADAGEDISDAQRQELYAIRDEAAEAIKAAKTMDEAVAAYNAADQAMADILLVDVSDKFIDVEDGKWYEEYIYICYHTGLMNGISDTVFGVNDPLTRGQLVTILYRAYGGDPVDNFENPFTDLDEKAFYYDAVIWAANMGYVTGTSKTTFAPNDKITREQFATILYRMIKTEEMEKPEAVLADYPDASKVSAYAVDGMNWAVANGIITGSAEGEKVYLNPGDTATRAQAAAILVRFLFGEA